MEGSLKDLSKYRKEYLRSNLLYNYIRWGAVGDAYEVRWAKLDLGADAAGTDEDCVEARGCFVDEGFERLLHADW